MSILKSVLAAGTGRVVLCYANRDEASVIFAAELRELAARYAGRLTVLHWLESIQGLPTLAQLGNFAQLYSGYQSFICGPGPFMSVVKETLTGSGIPRDHIHLEVFQSLDGDPFAEVVIEDLPADEARRPTPRSPSTVKSTIWRWPVGRNLVDTMVAAGIEVPYSCPGRQLRFLRGHGDRRTDRSG